MAEHYLNVLTVHLRDYAGHPLAENLTEAVSLAITVGTRIDLDQLANEIGDDLGSGPSRIQQLYTETNWGVSGSGAEILVDVSTAISGVASLQILWAAISQRILRHGKPRLLSTDQQKDAARTFLAESLNIGPESVQIVMVEPVGNGHRVKMETPSGSFSIEIDSDGVSRMHRD